MTYGQFLSDDWVFLVDDFFEGSFVAEFGFGENQIAEQTILGNILQDWVKILSF